MKTINISMKMRKINMFVDDFMIQKKSAFGKIQSGMYFFLHKNIGVERSKKNKKTKL